MVDAGIGRLLIASLHQGIADVSPTRLPFYENWLSPPGLRDGKFGLAPLHAVLSFLRMEGQPTYDQIMSRSGAYTADWAYTDLSSWQRAVARALPMPLRMRWALFLCKRMVAKTFKGARASSKLRKGTGTFDIHASIFCVVRERSPFPMCSFYRAAVERYLHRFDLDAEVKLTQCKASGAPGCTMGLTIRGERAAETAAEAA